ncbi:hypothetical protein IAT38_004499 [Cryptococcus sp. DSM 104549]
MTALDERLGALLEGRKQKGRFRTLKEYDTSSSSNLVDFSSNDYLSITSSTALRSLYLSCLAATPTIFGSTGSRLLSGGSPSHSTLEHRFAQFFNSPAALLFNSGWDANVSFFATVPQPGDWVVYDELVHASVHSGMRGSRVAPARRVAFPHNSPEGLAEVLKRVRKESEGEAGGSSSTVFLALESLYSMDGDMSPLPVLLDIMGEAGEWYMLWERRAGGGVEGGSTGKGRVDVRLMTFGKAVGSSGAVLLCSPVLRSFLINFARPFIFSTAMPHSTLVSLDCVWDVLQGEEGDKRRASLADVATYLHHLLAALLQTTPPNLLSLPPNPLEPFANSSSPYLPSNPSSPILGLLTPQPHALSAFLLERGFIVRPVVPPTVPPGGERVRICLRAGMEKDVIERLVGSLREWVEMRKKEGGVRAKL